jgi:uncharacterized membrane protein YjgN (DUF898 family)
MSKHILLVVLGAVAIGAVFIFGMSVGKQDAALNAKQELLDQIEEKELTREQIREMDNSGKCGLIGGVWRDGECQ